MKTALRFLGITLTVLVIALAAVLVYARSHDGPLAMLAGGPLASGELQQSALTDWSFARDIAEIELQLVDPPRSRTVWIALHEGRAYIPCGFIDLPIWKKWPHQAMDDGRAIVRIEGKRYPVQVARVPEGPEWLAVLEVVSEKYAIPRPEEGPDPETTWVFRLDARAS